MSDLPTDMIRAIRRLESAAARNKAVSAEAVVALAELHNARADLNYLIRTAIEKGGESRAPDAARAWNDWLRHAGGER